MIRLNIPLDLFRSLLRRLSGQRAVYCPVQIDRVSGGLDIYAQLDTAKTAHRLLLGFAKAQQSQEQMLERVDVVLLLNEGESEFGSAIGIVQYEGGLDFIQQVRFVGAGFYSALWPPKGPTPVLPAHLSRTIGALGESVWSRLTDLSYGIIGLGRSGSEVAHALARLNVKRMTLIDPDHIEPHNTGEMSGVTLGDVGQLKVDAVGDRLQQIHPALDCKRIARSITCQAAFEALRTCDFLFLCVDHNSARLAAEGIGVLHDIPRIDIGSGIVGTPEQPRIGYDVRLLLPGRPGRCLLCMGGLDDLSYAAQVISSVADEESFVSRRNWRERLGSLASLNKCAVGLALRTLEELCREEIEESRWFHAAFSGGGMEISQPDVSRATLGCPLCRLSGLGQEGIVAFRTLLRDLRDEGRV